jgi:MFS family permease
MALIENEMEPEQLPQPPARRLPLMALFVANGISMVGNVLALLAIPWFVLETTESAAKTGLTGFFTILPVVLAGLLGGALIDRLGFKPTSIIADLASAAAVALIPLLYLTVGLQFWQLAALVFLGALLDAPGSTARSAMIPDLAAMAGMPIERASSANQVIERSSRLVGAPLAGLLIAVIGTVNVLWLDAVSFIVSAAIVAAFVPSLKTVKEEPEKGRYLDELRDGIRFIRMDGLILAIIMIVLVTNFLDAAFGGVILPVYTNQVLGSALDLGLIIAASSAGAVVGAIIFGAVGHRLPRRLIFVSMFTLLGFRFWILALNPPLPAILLGMFLTGICAGPLNPIIDSVSYERVPTGLRGRVFGTIHAGAWVAMPLGVLLAGFFTEEFGVQPLLIAFGVIYIATTVLIGLAPALRGMDRAEEIPAGQT